MPPGAFRHKTAAALTHRSNNTMFWISWIACSVLFAALFSVVKTVDRLSHATD